MTPLKLFLLGLVVALVVGASTYGVFYILRPDPVADKSLVVPSPFAEDKPPPAKSEPPVEHPRKNFGSVSAAASSAAKSSPVHPVYGPWRETPFPTGVLWSSRGNIVVWSDGTTTDESVVDVTFIGRHYVVVKGVKYPLTSKPRLNELSQPASVASDG